MAKLNKEKEELNLESKNQGNNKKRPLKRSMIGLEMEFMLLNNKGKVVNKADEILAAVKKKEPETNIVKECGKNMVELGCYPSVKMFNTALDILKHAETLYDVASKKDLLLHCFGTYPGKFDPEVRNNINYLMKKKIFGEERFLAAARCIGFHHHYALPRGMYNPLTKFIRVTFDGKIKRSFMGSYNFEIAADPALTCIMQSSPFYQGQHFAMDTRLPVYRGGKKLKYMDGVYANLQQIGGLPPYKQTEMDLIESLNRKVQRWMKVLKKHNENAKFDEIYNSKLDVNWGPVKVNNHGTLEQRGMDMNYPSNIMATSVLLKFCLMKIHREFLEVEPADIGIKEPFKIEDNRMYVPPHTFVRNKLQYFSAYEGLNNKHMENYVKRFLRMAKKFTNKSYQKSIRPVINMYEENNTVSTQILKKARKLGWEKETELDNETAQELSLHFTDKFYKDLVNTIELLKKIDVTANYSF
ncbi:hypothetical protein HN695_04600 [Candidatus Woesearchaeota archaeon]|nr:hypothetical protein [Candidatus Woesearchaeota archaeon]MBT5271856.1 hypothetical protein [Candidatus Woesearchaeota archaeon]MBT6041680.1 hypothetical protein [Candidatus Woesearchaeota archaeon]MBT6337344.1 hypothetical protein [Candidatus Woesearchaeota archaeon]MBT7927592.1 hypothetical protein [Candidatus Woesearchaeota archaeon]